MSYISTFEVKNQKLLCNMDNVHKTIMKMFRGSRQEENVLFMATNNKIILQSDNQPEAGNTKGLKLLNCRECSKDLEKLENGRSVVLFTILEPTKKQKRKEKYSANIMIKNVDERIAWVKKKLADAGVSVFSVNEIGKTDGYVEKNDGNETLHILCSYEISGKIQDKDLFLSAVRKGIGRSKAYGAGLCLVVG